MPFSNPASRASSQNFRATRKASGDGLMTTVFPQAQAGPTFDPRNKDGVLYAVKMPATP